MTRIQFSITIFMKNISHSPRTFYTSIFSKKFVRSYLSFWNPLQRFVDLILKWAHERVKGIEPSTSSLARKHCTIQLHPHCLTFYTIVARLRVELRSDVFQTPAVTTLATLPVLVFSLSGRGWVRTIDPYFIRVVLLPLSYTPCPVSIITLVVPFLRSPEDSNLQPSVPETDALSIKLGEQRYEGCENNTIEPEDYQIVSFHIGNEPLDEEKRRKKCSTKTHGKHHDFLGR